MIDKNTGLSYCVKEPLMTVADPKRIKELVGAGVVKKSNKQKENN